MKIKLVTLQITSLQRTVSLFVTVFITFFSISQNSKKATFYSTDNIDFVNKSNFYYSDTLTFQKNFSHFQKKVWKNGYWTFSLDSTQIDSSKNVALYVSLGPKYKHIQLSIDTLSEKQLNLIGFSKRFLKTDYSSFELANQLETILKTFENNGYPFIEIKTTKIDLSNDEIIQLNLSINAGPLFKWNEIILKSENKIINERYLKALLKIQKGEYYSEEDARLIKDRIIQSGFLEEIKPAEISFQNGYADIYLYLKSKRNSSFNGIIGLQQDPIKLKVGFTGEIRLKLENSFKRGESFQLYWRSVNPGSPQFNTQLSLPFLFNTPFGLFGQFQLIKRDTSFIETKPSIGVLFNLKNGSSLKAFYKNYQSSTLGNTGSVNGFGSVKSNQYGLNFTYQTLDYRPNPRKGIYWSTEATIGSREVNQNNDTTFKSSVYSGKTNFEIYSSIKKRFVIKTAFQCEVYQSPNTQTNELIRFGGNNTQRGFLEDEFFSTTRATLTVEPRFILDQNSFLFVFFDQTWYEKNSENYSNDSPYGFGAGLSFGTDIGIFSITYAIGSQQGNPILLRDSKIHFGYVAFF